jgi:hypothetical protein
VVVAHLAVAGLVAVVTSVAAVDVLDGTPPGVVVGAVRAFLGGVAELLLLQARLLAWRYRVLEVVLVAGRGRTVMVVLVSHDRRG